MTNTTSPFGTLASQDSLDKTVTSLSEKKYTAVVVKTKEEALAQIKHIIPDGASVMNGASVTLEQVGYMNYLSEGNHPWVDLHAKIKGENDAQKRAQLRKDSIVSDYYLGSVHALTEDGQMVIASNTGSQLPHITFTSQNLIFVVSTKKIVSSLADAMKRLEEYVIPLEDARMMKAMNMHTTLNKILILKGDPEFLGRKIHVILVEEDLGY